MNVIKLKLKKLVSLSRHDELRKIGFNTIWLFADRIFRMGVGLFVGVWVARYLGVEQFGLFSYAMAFVGLFSTLSTLGLPSLIIRTITNEPEKREEILGTTFWLQLFGGTAAVLISLGMMLALNQDNRLALSLVAILGSAGVFKAFDTVDLWFQSQVQSKYTVLAQNSAFIIAATLKVILINIQAPLMAFAGVTLVEAVIKAFGLVFFYTLQGYSIRLWQWSLPLAKTLLRESWPLILSGFTIMIYMKIDQIMLGKIVGSQAVGLYSSATKISEVWYFIPTAVASSVSPSIYAAKKNADEILYYLKIERQLKFLSLTAILIALPMTFMSEKIITTLFGNDYAAAGSILAIHIWAAVFVFIGVGSSCWFIAEGLTHLPFQRALIGAVINLTLNFLLIPIYGGLGAAIATVVSQAFSAFISNAFHPKAVRIFEIQIKSLIPFFFSSILKSKLESKNSIGITYSNIYGGFKRHENTCCAYYL